MKTFIYSLVGLGLLFSCMQLKCDSTSRKAPDFKNENFKFLPTEEINRLIQSSEKQLTPEKIVKIYYPHKASTNEGNEKLEIKFYRINAENVLIVLTHDNKLDDSFRGQKFVMKLKKHKASWPVVSIRTNWTCYKGRGHTNWDTLFCR